MIEVQGKSPGDNVARVVKVYVRENGRIDLWICPPGTPSDGKNGWAIRDVPLSELLVSLGQKPAAGW